MRTHKSHISFFADLYDTLLRKDMVRQYGQSSSFERDCIELHNRVKNEGFSFLTKTLPNLGKAIDLALQTGQLDRPKAFKKAYGAAYPAFLQVLLERVFTQDGSIKEEPCLSAVSDLRQILYLVYKYEVNYEKSVIDKYLSTFKSVDIGLGWEKPNLDDEGVRVLDTARTLLGRVFMGIDFEYIEPKHGPGAVATGEKNWEKMEFSRRYECIHQVYPYYFNFYSNAMDLASRVKHYKGLEKYPSGISKVELVPKDSRGPRMICMEPLEFQWVQQGLSKLVVQQLERHTLTRGKVNFKNQEVNRQLALDGSCSNGIVTLDMKEASDRISLWLVRELFADLPVLLKRLLGTRTEATELPNGEIHLMRKFAPMGSALCFPIESAVHWALSVASLNVRGVTLKRALRAVYVYGDDIIIKGENHVPLFDLFPVFGLMFNAGKSCTEGSFRESCGMDAMLGTEVTPLKVKKPMPNKPWDANGYVSYIEYCNTLWEKAYYSASNLLKNHLTCVFGEIPHVLDGADCPGLKTTRLPASNAHRYKKRWNKSLHRNEYRVRKVRSRLITRPLNRSEYQRKLLNKSNEFVAGVYSVPRRVKLEMGWSAALQP